MPASANGGGAARARFKHQQGAHAVTEQRERPIEIRLDGIGDRLREHERVGHPSLVHARLAARELYGTDIDIAWKG